MTSPKNVIIRSRRCDKTQSQQLSAQGIHPLLADLYSARGVSSAKETDYRWRHLLPPHNLKDCAEAARHLADAIEQQQRLLIVADYDCDGATACALAIRGLRLLGATVDFVVPNRFETGYGLSPDVIDMILARTQAKPDLIITVDNGIASIEGVRYAKQHGMSVIVTDHHLPGDTLPEALAIVNPNQGGCQFPSKHLAGVGVMYYVLIGLRAELKSRGHFGEANQPTLHQFADLVALGTVADVVTLDANNRILVAQGLERIRQGQMQAGIRALFEVAKTPFERASTDDLGFRIGPRINAVGRLADMTLGIHCLITDDEEHARQLAHELNAINVQRREIEGEMHRQAQVALAYLDQAQPQQGTSAHPDGPQPSTKAPTPGAATTPLDTSLNSDETQRSALCIYHPDWHQGVIGLVASRLKTQYWRPVVAFAPGDDGELRGSGRSIPQVHLRDALDLVSKRQPGIIIKFGGHAMAAGLSLDAAHLDTFEQALHEAIIELTGQHRFDPIIETDGSLATEHTSYQIALLLNRHVWGAGFPAPTFNDVFLVREQRLLQDKHLKLKLEKDHQLFDAIWFGHNEPLDELVQVVYKISPNEWNGQFNVQLMIDYAESVTTPQACA